MVELGKAFVVLGSVTIVIGLLLWSGVGRGWFGHLPGDIHIVRENASFHFPVVTCLLLSVLLALVMWLIKK
jgi:ribose/xylose/arabinose/galactoside ABC-type transport system permease subunit